mmetsp:Transcript_50735/g.120606  ORF Transcript_50735/g.120606 Transcript_50735/m.120606 type:complete len:83 (+) Transcript_50735:3-251(+)
MDDDSKLASPPQVRTWCETMRGTMPSRQRTLGWRKNISRGLLSDKHFFYTPAEAVTIPWKRNNSNNYVQGSAALASLPASFR